MNLFSGKALLSLLLLSLSSVAVAANASHKTPGDGGVVLDLRELGVVVAIPVEAGNAAGAVASVAQRSAPATVPSSVTRDVPAADPAKVTMPKVTLIEASAGESAAEETADSDAFKRIVDAMRPGDTVPPLANDRFTFYLSEKVAFSQFERSASRYGVERARLHLAALVSEERDTVLHAGLALDSSSTKIRLSFGTRAYIALLNMENTDAFAAALGVEAAYQLPFKPLPLELGASLYYAPDILTFGAGDRAIDAQFDIALPFRSSTSVFAGLRFLQVDTRPLDREVDNRVHLGLRWDLK